MRSHSCQPVQPLEPRQYFAYSLDGGVLTITDEPVVFVTLSLKAGRLDVIATSGSSYGRFRTGRVREIRMTGTAGNDMLGVLDQRGPIPADVFVNGQGGDDDIDVGGAIRAEVFGGPGEDRLRGSAGPDTLDGGRGDDRLTGKAGNDLIVGGPGEDFLDGDVGRDRLLGGPGADRLDGDDSPRKGGRDILIGNADRDTLVTGNSGDDVLFQGDEVLT
jgi:Ca2+-binding RTX toxin-like protein